MRALQSNRTKAVYWLIIYRDLSRTQKTCFWPTRMPSRFSVIRQMAPPFRRFEFPDGSPVSN